MPEGEDWVMKPIIEGCCKYESLINGELTLADFARMNLALEVKWENERRRSKKESEEDGSRW